jgi:hypothetical protein
MKAEQRKGWMRDEPLDRKKKEKNSHCKMPKSEMCCALHP